MDTFKKIFMGIGRFFFVFFRGLFEINEETLEDMRPICSKCGQLKEQLPTILALNAEPDVGGFNTVTRYHSCKHCELQTQKE